VLVRRRRRRRRRFLLRVLVTVPVMVWGSQ